VPVTLLAGNNTITFGNHGNLRADLDRIVISGDGSAVAPDSPRTRQKRHNSAARPASADAASAQAGPYVWKLRRRHQNAVTFPAVTVTKAGTYHLEIDYTTSGVRTFYIYVNNGPPTILNVNGSTFDSPVPVVIPVQLMPEQTRS